MLTVVIGTEMFDETDQEFVIEEAITLELEHSLFSMSKWESKWEKPFLSKEAKSTEETIDYIRMMTLTPNISPEAYEKLSAKNIEEINDYIAAKMTATWFSDLPGAPVSKSREIVTSEVIYYWMISFNIPFECEHWHLNRLFTLIRVCNTKQAKPKKMSRAEVAARQRELNAQRKAQLGTRG